MLCHKLWCYFPSGTYETVKCNRLTRVYDRLEGEVAGLNVEGEFVNAHPAGADQHLVVRYFNFTITVNDEKRIWRGSVLLCPVGNHGGIL